MTGSRREDVLTALFDLISSDPSDRVRFSARVAVGRLGDVRSVHFWIRLLKGGTDEERTFWAIDGIKVFGETGLHMVEAEDWAMSPSEQVIRQYMSEVRRSVELNRLLEGKSPR